MRIMRTMINNGNATFPVDTIEHKGKLWLVPNWIVSPEEGWQSPVRIVRPIKSQIFPSPPGFSRTEYQLAAPVSVTVLGGVGRMAELADYEVVERPHIQIGIPSDVH